MAYGIIPRPVEKEKKLGQPQWLRERQLTGAIQTMYPGFFDSKIKKFIRSHRFKDDLYRIIKTYRTYQDALAEIHDLMEEAGLIRGAEVVRWVKHGRNTMRRSWKSIPNTVRRLVPWLPLSPSRSS